MLREQQLFVKFSKCNFFKYRIQYLGYVVSNDGILVDPDKIKSIMECPVPKNTIDIISFMGIIDYYHKFIEGFLKQYIL